MDDRAAGDRERAMRRAAEIGLGFLDSLPDRPVGASTDAATLRARLTAPLPEQGTDALTVVEELAEAVEPGLIGSTGPRYFGFVIGGALPAAVPQALTRKRQWLPASIPNTTNPVRSS